MSCFSKADWGYQNEGNVDNFGDFSADSTDVEEKNMNSPCYECKRPQKRIGCHSGCEEYIRFCDENTALREKIRREKERRSARQKYMTDKQFQNAGQSFNKVFKQHKK